MKNSLFAVLLTLFLGVQLSAQTFTKITTGSIVNDGAASRSVNWVDYNGDGYLDMFVSSGKEGGEFNFLYKNNHDGTFTKVINDPIVTTSEPYDGASWVDADGDGDLDCFV
ncbi:MAG: VCBS repeat-containing protein, partial [bacterium]